MGSYGCSMGCEFLHTHGSDFAWGNVTFYYRGHVYWGGKKSKGFSIEIFDPKIDPSPVRIRPHNIFDGKIELKNNEFSETDIASHLKEKYHANIFTQKIINLLK
mgnify:CR=1 FL=1